MESRHTALLAFPLVLAMFLMVSYSVISNSQSKSLVTETFAQSTPTSDDDCSACSDSTTLSDCRDANSGAVMGGLDFVQYFTEFKFANGTYDEDQVGSAGSSSYSSVFNGYTFYFKSSANKDIFDSSPASYIPQWGGFCSWGVAGEYCPSYEWTANCLGPDGSWDAWTIVNEKLYFFKESTPKAKFKNDVTGNVEAGDTRWNYWFGDSALAQFNTNCYTESS